MKLPKDLQKKYKKKHSTKRTTNHPKKLPEQGSFDELKHYLNLASAKERKVNIVENQKMMNRIQTLQPVIKNNILKNIEELEALFKNYNPIHLLHFLCIQYTLFNPETYRESESMELSFWVEYALSFATSIQIQIPSESPDTDTLNKLESLIKSITNLTTQYYMVEATDGKPHNPLKGVRFKSILDYMLTRGDSYESHHKEFVLQSFQPHDNFLKENFGYTIKEILEFIDNIRDEVLDHIKHDANREVYYKKFKELIEKYKESEGETLTERDLATFESNEEMVKLREEFQEYMLSYEPFYYRIKPSTEIPRELLDIFSLEFGENKEFLRGDKYWALNNSLIYSKPIIKLNDEFYGFGMNILYYNIIEIVESLILEQNKKYFEDKYLKKKSALLEKLSLKYLSKIMPQATIYSKLFYYLNKEGKRTEYETDGLILFDDIILIVEAKSHKLTLSAKRGSLLRIENRIKKIIDDAYNQGIRCKQYIINNKQAEFYDKDNKKVLTIKGENYNSFYIINTTYENLGHLSTQLHILKNFNLIEGKEWLWSVFINDLRIISEIIESPSIFLLYLQRRIQMNDLGLITNSDELDYYMFFLKTGLYFEEINISETQRLSLFGQTDELDRYYFYIQGKIKEKVEKPVFGIPDFYKEIIFRVENSGKKGFFKASFSLVSIDSKDFEKISTLISKYKNLSFITGKGYKFFLYYRNLKKALLFVIKIGPKTNDWTQYREYLKLMQYKYKIKLAIMYTFVFDNPSDKIPYVDFEIFELEWKFDSKLDRLTKKNNFKGMRKIKKGGSLDD